MVPIVMLFSILLFLWTETTSLHRACPVFCICSPDTIYGPWSFKARCQNDNMQRVPVMTPNITRLKLVSKNLVCVDGFAFAGSCALKSIRIRSYRLARVHKDAFHCLTDLSTLNIWSTQMVYLSPGVFKILPLQTIILTIHGGRIPSEKLCDGSELQYLTLKANNISIVGFDQCVAKAWTRLSVLNLEQNPLGKNISADDFYYLKDIELKQLVLRQCDLVTLPNDLLRHLTYITNLDLGQNKISFLPPELFESLTRLKALVVDGTDLVKVPFDENNPIMPGLEELNVGHSQITELVFDRTFLNATSLEFLMISGSRLDVLEDSLLFNLANSPLNKISLAASRISKISTGVFKFCQTLKTLILSQNPLRTEGVRNLSMSVGKTPLQELIIDISGLASLDNQTFLGFSENNSLAELSLQSNEITRIGTGSFAHLKMVLILKLNHNLLTSDALEHDAFMGMYSLRELLLDDNKITDMPSRVLLGISQSLQRLSLVRNRLGILSFRRFEEWSNLSDLDLSSNNIKAIGKGVFNPLKRLIYLDLSDNRIRSFDKHQFYSLTLLRWLLLGGNQLTMIPLGSLTKLAALQTLSIGNNPTFTDSRNQYVFKGLINLQLLYIGNCAFKTLRTGIFEDNHNLSTVMLSGNRISSWNADVFKPLSKSATLVLSHNKITSVNETSFKHLIALIRLDLSGNPLACSCDLLWFKNWISSADFYLVNYGVKGQYSCASPQTEKGTDLIDFQLTDNDCASKLVLHLMIGICSSFTLICVISSLTYRYWWYVRYYIFLMRSRRRQAEDALFENDAFRYDVYVCYHNTSLRWVINQLLPELEYKGGIKLCLHDRDWLAGPAILDNILESIECSRKTLLLVNNGFAQSAWCREETSLAYHRLVLEKRNLLTIVLLEDIQPENMDSTLRAILTKRVYLKYTCSERKEPMFWKALRAALRKPEQADGVEMARP